MPIRYLIGVALISSLLGAGSAAHAQPTQTRASARAVSAAADARLQLRELWSDRAMWSRAVLIADVNQAPDAEAASGRLSTNDENLAHTLGRFYGESAGRDLLQAFHEQSTTLRSVARAARTSKGTLGTSASDPTNMQWLLQHWYATRDPIDAVLLRGDTSSDAGLPDALQSYLSATMKELTARVNDDWAGDVKAFDEAHDSAMRVADETANRIALQSPERRDTTGTSGIR